MSLLFSFIIVCNYFLASEQVYLTGNQDPQTGKLNFTLNKFPYTFHQHSEFPYVIINPDQKHMQITFTISNLIGIKKYFLHPRI
jgi:hypothetical protein